MPAASVPSPLLPEAEVRASESGAAWGDASWAETRATAWSVWRLAWPAIGHMLLLTLVFAVDRLVLGRTDTTALASLQISTVLVWTATSIFTAFSAGTLAVAGRAFGANDRRAAGQAAAVSLVLALVLGVVVAAVMSASSGRWLPVVFPQAGDAVLTDVGRYLAIVLPVLPFAFVEAIAAAALQSAGDTKSPLVAAGASNVLNLFVSCTLVFGLFGAPRLGVQGAALGAACAMVLQAALLLRVLLRERSALPVRACLLEGRGAVDPLVIQRIVRVSVPAFADKVVYAGGFLVFVVLVAWLGAVDMAANQAISSVEAICFLSAEGFGVAAGALVAQNLGAGAPARAERVASVAAGMAVATLGLFALIFLAAPRALLGVFSSDGAVVGAATTSLLLAAVSQPFMAYATVTRMALRGAGATASVLYVTLAGTFLVRLPIAFALSIGAGWGLAGLWVGSTLDWIVQAVAFAWILKRGGWKA